MKQYVDRGDSIKGIERTMRDNRVPFNYPRKIENFNLPDGRARRRPGFLEAHKSHVTQALCKSSGVSFNQRFGESGVTKNTTVASPLSYGVIKHQADYQLKRSQAFTIEFMLRLGDKEELVRNPFSRLVNGTYVMREPGVYVFDQSLTSNSHQYNTGSINDGAVAGVATVNVAPPLPPLPLTTVAFGYTESKLFCIFGMVEKTGGSTGRYWPKNTTLQFTFPGSSYTVGDVYHVALVHDPTLGSFGRLMLYVNGTLAQTLNLPDSTVYEFIGGYDKINGVTYASGQKRDIVILNEYTVRASYSSACKVGDLTHGFQTLHHDFSTTTTGLYPWACSPPRGTAMWDLRIWAEARNSTNINANKGKRVLTSDGGLDQLKGNWFLNDGGPICVNKATGFTKRYCTIHHGYPGYISESKFVNGLGLKFTDGQHLVFTSLANDKFLGSGISAKLGYVFGFDTDVGPGGTLEHQARNDFTVQMQITVPDALQAELNVTAGANQLKDITLVAESRDDMGTSRTNGLYHLRDGSADSTSGPSSRKWVGQYNEAAGPDTKQHHRAYDQTLFSVEGRQIATESTIDNNEPQRRRVPVARGLITPAGKIAFELYKHRPGASPPTILRLVSTTALTVGSVYTVTFVERCNFAVVGDIVNASGWVMEIWLQNLTAGTPAALDSSFTVPVEGAPNIHTSPLIHKTDYDICIGASYVNDGWDWSINMADPAATAAANSGSSNGGGVPTPRGNFGPWPTQQRFMSPYQDQPGSFICGCFRLWSLALPVGSIKEYGNSVIASKEYSNDLLVNLEFEEITGISVPSKCRYPEIFNMGFKGWGFPQGTGNNTQQINNIFIPRRSLDAGWAMEDCLGYMHIVAGTTPLAYNSRQQNTQVNGIIPFKSTTAQQFGVLSVYDDSVAFDKEVQSQYVPLFISGSGLLSEFSSGDRWSGVVVGDRTFLTAFGGLPKVFNGRTMTTAGFRKWSGGNMYVTPSTNGSLTSSLWYGVAVVYYSEQYNIYHVSPIATIKLQPTQDEIVIADLPGHPDPRISIVEIYRTIGQATEDLARNAPLYKTRILGLGGNLNAASTRISITEADTELSPAVLDRNVTEFPQCAYCTTLNGRLYLTGDILKPDSVYFSDPGNPERIDTLVNVIEIEEGSGDAPTGIVAAFGSVFVFKPNALWRIDDLGNNRHQQTRLANVGAIAPSSIHIVVNPDTGRTSIFFWSQHGPYMFDGSTFQYIGASIEESVVADIPAKQYHWLDPRSVVVGHNANEREIICVYSPVIGAGDNPLNKQCDAIVFNYRFNSWVKYTGVKGNVALSLSFTGDTHLVDPQPDSELGSLSQSFTYKLIFGGDNGRIYYWGEDQQDGVPFGLALANPYTLSAISANLLTISSATPGGFDLSGLWITIVSTITGNWVVAPIVTNEGSNITVHADWPNEVWDFIPAVGSLVYLCRPPAYIEFPWDELGVPFMDKQINMLITWHYKDIKYRQTINYDMATQGSWTNLSTGDSDRKKTVVNKRCESYKLELKSHELSAQLDAFAYQVHFASDGNTPGNT